MRGSVAFGKHHPLRMPLQFFDDVANETHGDRLAAKLKLQNEFAIECNARESTIVCKRTRT